MSPTSGYPLFDKIIVLDSVLKFAVFCTETCLALQAIGGSRSILFGGVLSVACQGALRSLMNRTPSSHRSLNRHRACVPNLGRVRNAEGSGKNTAAIDDLLKALVVLHCYGEDYTNEVRYDPVPLRGSETPHTRLQRVLCSEGVATYHAGGSIREDSFWPSGFHSLMRPVGLNHRDANFTSFCFTLLTI